MKRVAVALVAVMLGACGGKIESVTEPTVHRPADPQTPTPAPAPTQGDLFYPDPVDPPAQPMDDLGAKLPPTEGVPCAAGQIVEMSYRISEWNMSHGASSNAGAGYCVGTVQFQEAPYTIYNWDENGKERVSANGKSVNLDPQDIPSHVHTSTLYYADGRTELQYCTFWALCENGVARSVAFTW